MPDLWALLSIAAGFLLYIGVLGSAGLVMVRLVLGPETARIHSAMRRQAAALALLALAAAATCFLLRGAALAGDAAGMADAELLGLLWRGPPGTRLLLLGSGLLLLVAGLGTAGTGAAGTGAAGRWIAAAGALLALWSFTRIGHVAGIGAVWLEALLVLHLAAAAFWIGVLAPLHRLAADPAGTAAAAALASRFGRIATVAVAVLVAAGIVMAMRLLGGAAALTATGYGLTLIAKLAAVALLLGVAAHNRLRVVPALRRGEAAAATRLRRTIALEWLAVGAILLATATLTALRHPPGLQ